MSLNLKATYEQEADRVFGFLARFGLAGPDLEDAVHDTFVTAASRASSFDDTRPVAPWLLGIAFRVAVARVRNARVHVSHVPDVSDPSQDPERSVAARQAQEVVKRALVELSEEQGTVFVLHDLQGVSANEISQAMGAPLATTYSRLRLARVAFAAAVARIRRKEPVP